MPPKDSKKANEKKKAKVIEDRTFGLKNKNKSVSASDTHTMRLMPFTMRPAAADVPCFSPSPQKKVQQYVKAVETSVSQAGISTQARREQERLKAAKEAMKIAKEQAEMEKAALFRTAVAKTVVPHGVDPKSVLCEFFKAGKCVRGAKCKYSHDMEVTRKVAKIDLYSDPRQLDTMDKWDQSKLEEVVGKKQKGTLPPTQIVCKYFLDAIENSQYGWFWQCPSGEDCHYRHCLPPGFILKTKADKLREKEAAEGGGDEEETLEDKIDAQRKALDLSKCTPLTLELFTKWKADKEARRAAEVEVKRKEAEKKATGSGVSVMSGRDLFRYDPTLFADDEDAAEEYTIDEEYDPALANGDSDEDDINAKNYDSQAESGEDEEEDGEDGEEEDGDEEEDDGEEKKEDRDVAKAAAAIDKSLFLDDEVPDE
jgi:hypothetical protein